MADYGSDDSNTAAVSDGSGSEADLGTDKPMEKTKYLWDRNGPGKRRNMQTGSGRSILTWRMPASRL